MSEEDICSTTESMLQAARQGAVQVSLAISPDEKSVMRAAFKKKCHVFTFKKMD